MSDSLDISVKAPHSYSKWAGIIGVLLIGTVVYDLATIGLWKATDGSFNWRIGFNFILGLSLLLQTYRLARHRFVRSEEGKISWCLGEMKKAESVALTDIIAVKERPTALELSVRSGQIKVLSLSELGYSDVQRLKSLLKDHLTT